MNKRGMGAFGIILIVLFLVAIIGTGVYVGVTQSGLGAGTPTATTNNCETAPYITLSGLNASALSQTVSPTYNHRVNELYRGTLTSGSAGTTFSLGDKVEILATSAGYKDIILPEVTITKCASNDVNFEIWSSGDGTFTLFNSNGVAMTDDIQSTPVANSVNQSAISAGSTADVKIKLVSGGKQSINPSWISVELHNKTQVDDLTMSSITPGLTITEQATPKFFSSENTTTSSYVEFFRVEGLRDAGAVNELSLTIKAASSYAMSSQAVYVNGYSEQAFVETDGTFKTGVIDSAGTTKYELKFTDYDFRVGA